jgi:hypothetical protein
VETPLTQLSNFGGPDLTEVPEEIAPPNLKKQGVQINAEGWPGPRQKDGTTTFNLFPAGAFSRETDVFKIPTIGAYKILTRAVAAPTVTPDNMTLPATVEDITNLAEAGNFTEMNTVAMDHSFADDEDPDSAATAATGTAPVVTAGKAPAQPPLTSGFDDAYEQVGRLCPTSTLNPAVFVNYPNTWAAPASYVAPDDTTGEAPNGNTTRSPVDFYDPNFDFTTGLVSTKATRTIFDYFTVMGHSNVLPNVGLDEYVTTYQGTNLPNTPPQYPQYLPTSSSPKAATRAPNITYMVADTGTTATVLHRGQNVPPQSTSGNKIDYSNCVVQVVSGARRGLLGQIDNGTGDAMSLTAPGITGLTAGDIVRVVSTTEETPTDSGLININTAPWYVLARLPLVQVAGSPAVDAQATSDLAKRIVQYRDGNPLGNTPYERRGHGPFKSILDLNRVMDAAGTEPIFQESIVTQTGTKNVDPTVMSTDINGGDISPSFRFTYAAGKRTDAGSRTPAVGPPVTPESVPGDFENRYLTLSRIANMVTTRSDAFVVYVQLQGWRGAGTAGAEMVTQRKAAFIIDRSTASETVSPSTVRVPVK